MDKALRSTIIVLIAIIAMAIATVAVNANRTSVTSVNLTQDSITVNAGSSIELKVSYSYSGEAPDTADINWISSNSSVATVKNTKKAYKQLNKYRKAKKLKALKRDKKLEKIALQRAKEMAETGKLSHTRPNGKSGLTLIKGNKAKGENIAKGQNTCSQVSTAWYKSPGHRKNMLRKNFKKVGIAGYTYNGVTYWAQVFSN